MVRNRKDDRGESVRDQLQRAYGDIQNRWPDVETLTLELRFTDENARPLAAFTTVLDPQDSTFLWFGCREQECVDGGFDLNAAALEMIRDDKTEVSGRLICQGWQDPERVGLHRCLWELYYTMTCLYRDPPGA